MGEHFNVDVFGNQMKRSLGFLSDKGLDAQTTDGEAVRFALYRGVQKTGIENLDCVQT